MIHIINSIAILGGPGFKVSFKYESKVNISSLAYNRHETRDKRPLGRGPDRSWCHRHMIAAHGFMDIGGSIRVCCRSVPTFTSVIG